MPSKLVVDRQKCSKSVLAAGQTNAAAIGLGISALLAPHAGEGVEVPDAGTIVQLSVGYLRAAEQRMEETDLANAQELKDDEAPRTERDEAAGALAKQLIEIRQTLEGVFGPQTARAAGFAGPTPEDPAMLARFAGEVATTLKKVVFPKPRMEGVTFTLGDTPKRIEDSRAALELKMKDVAREAREAQATLDAKNQAIAEYDERFSKVAGLISALLRFAGKDELADKVRPSIHHPGRTEAIETTETPA